MPDETDGHPFQRSSMEDEIPKQQARNLEMTARLDCYAELVRLRVLLVAWAKDCREINEKYFISRGYEAPPLTTATDKLMAEALRLSALLPPEGA